MSDREPRPALIINGDDFGLSPGVNRAIIDAHRQGVLTSASLMVNEDAATDAVLRARETPTLAVGLHLSLVLGKASLPSTEIGSIVDSRGRFSSSPVGAGIRYFFSPQSRRELRKEMRAQFEHFAGTGLPFSHVDGHNHLHMHPVVFDELIALCEEFGVKRVRLVDGDPRTHLAITGRLHAGGRVISWTFRRLSRHCQRRLEGRGFVAPCAVHGLFHTDQPQEAYLIELLRKMPRAKAAEIYLHPLSANATEAERRENPRGMGDLEALLSPRVRSEIELNGFRLATYGTM